MNISLFVESGNSEDDLDGPVFDEFDGKFTVDFKVAVHVPTGKVRLNYARRLCQYHSLQ